MKGIVCGPIVYEYCGYVFEVHSYFGPFELRKRDWQIKKVQSKKFLDMYANKFSKLTESEKESWRIDGGAFYI